MRSLLHWIIVCLAFSSDGFGGSVDDYLRLADEVERPARLIRIEGGELRLTAQSAKQLTYLEKQGQVAIIVRSGDHLYRVALVDAGMTVREMFDVAVETAGMRKLDMLNGYYRVDGNPKAVITVFGKFVIICRKPYPPTIDADAKAEYDADMSYRLKPGDVYELELAG